MSIEIPQSMQLLPPSSQSVTVVEINDPTAIGEALEWVEQDVVLLDSRPLLFRRVSVRLKTVQVLFLSTNRPGCSHTKLQDGYVAFVAFGPKASGRLNGLAVGPDRVLVSPSGVEVEFVVAAGYESVTFLLSQDSLHAHVRRRLGEHDLLPIHGVQLLQASHAAARRLYGLGRRLSDAAAKKPDLFELPLASTVAEDELLDSLLAILRSTAPVDPTSQDRTRQAHSRVVQIAQAYALKQTTERLHMIDLCEAAGVSERTLQYAFKELLGMSPVTYLNRLRLHRVRRALRAASLDSTTVTHEALRWGFWHLGDFSRAYKDCFGELPSDTLRRQPEAGDSWVEGRQ